jgi:hypothetical protein
MEMRLAAALATSLICNVAYAEDENHNYRAFGAGTLTCGRFINAIDGHDPHDKDTPQQTLDNFKRFVSGWITAADRFIPHLNDASGGRNSEWFTGVLVNHCRVHNDLQIADALDQIPILLFTRTMMRSS